MEVVIVTAFAEGIWVLRESVHNRCLQSWGQCGLYQRNIKFKIMHVSLSDWDRWERESHVKWRHSKLYTAKLFIIMDCKVWRFNFGIHIILCQSQYHHTRDDLFLSPCNKQMGPTRQCTFKSNYFIKWKKHCPSSGSFGWSNEAALWWTLYWHWNDPVNKLVQVVTA